MGELVLNTISLTRASEETCSACVGMSATVAVVTGTSASRGSGLLVVEQGWCHVIGLYLGHHLPDFVFWSAGQQWINTE